MPAAQLTAERVARIPEFIGKWTEIGLSTDPVDRQRAKLTLCRLYRKAGLAEPHLIWARCPMTAMLSAIVYTAIRATGQETDCRDERKLAALVDRMTHGALLATVAPASRRPLRLAIERRVAAALRRGSEIGSGPAVGSAIRSRFMAGLGTHVTPTVEKILRAYLARPIRAALRPSALGIIEWPLHLVARGVGGAQTRFAAEACFGTPFWLSYAGLMDYANQVLGLPLDRTLLDAAATCGPFWMLDGLCFAADRPAYRNRDAVGRLHGETGPSCGYRSGLGWWHWHGVEVPQQVVEAPQRITIAAIDREHRPGARRVMIERYRHGDRLHGVAAVLRDAGGVRLDHDEVFGTLWRRDLPREPILMLEVVNRSREPDGSYKRCVLRVHPELRPIRADGSYGEPQPFTARNAVASTFGLQGAEYRPDLET